MADTEKCRNFDIRKREIIKALSLPPSQAQLRAKIIKQYKDNKTFSVMKARFEIIAFTGYGCDIIAVATTWNKARKAAKGFPGSVIYDNERDLTVDQDGNLIEN